MRTVAGGQKITYVINPRHACTARVTVLVLCVSVFPSAGANLRTGADSCLTEGTSGLSGILFTKIRI